MPIIPKLKSLIQGGGCDLLDLKKKLYKIFNKNNPKSVNKETSQKMQKIVNSSVLRKTRQEVLLKKKEIFNNKLNHLV